MRKIVVSIENNEYKIQYDEEKDNELTTEVLKRATKDYSRDRLEFKEDEDYKIFTIKHGDKKNKIIVAKNEEILKNNIEKIISEIHVNTALFVDLSKTYEAQDGAIYNCEINSRTTFCNENRIIGLCITNAIFRLLVILSFAFSPFPMIALVLIVKLFVDYTVLGVSCAADAKFVYSFKTWLFASGIIGLVDGMAYSLIKKVKNIIADIKNDNFIRRIKSHFKKKKKVKEEKQEKNQKTNQTKNDIDEVITNLFDELEKDKIHVEPIMFTPQPVSKLDNPNSTEEVDIALSNLYLIRTIEGFISNLSMDDKSKYQIELNKILINPMNDVMNNEIKSRNVYSELLVLYERILQNVQYGNIDNSSGILEGNELIKARR